MATTSAAAPPRDPVIQYTRAQRPRPRPASSTLLSGILRRSNHEPRPASINGTVAPTTAAYWLGFRIGTDDIPTDLEFVQDQRMPANSYGRA
jgi:hypothetical protein